MDTFTTENTKYMDPEGVLDYLFDFRDWLQNGATISTKTVTADNGITVDSSSIVNGSTGVRVWLSSPSVDNEYEVKCKIVTTDSQTDVRRMKIVCQER